MGRLVHDFDIESLQAKHASDTVLPFADLDALAKAFGLSSRLSSGPHRRHLFSYPGLGRPVAVHEKRASTQEQRRLIKRCIDLCRIQLEEHEQKASFENDANVAVKEDLHIPDGFKIREGVVNTNYYLVSTEFPQIATQLIKYELPNIDQVQAEIWEKQKYLSGRIEDLRNVLSEAKQRGFTWDRFPNGTIFISHPQLDMTEQLNAFRPKRENFTCIGVVESLRDTFDDLKDAHAKLLDAVIAAYGLKREQDTGADAVTLTYEDIFQTQSPEIFHIPCIEGGIPDPAEIKKLATHLHTKTWSRFKQDSRKYLGANVTRDSSQAYFSMRHPCFEGEEQNILNFMSDETQIPDLTGVFDLCPESQKAAILEALRPLELRVQSYTDACAARDHFIGQIKERVNMVSSMFAQVGFQHETLVIRKKDISEKRTVGIYDRAGNHIGAYEAVIIQKTGETGRADRNAVHVVATQAGMLSIAPLYVDGLNQRVAPQNQNTGTTTPVNVGPLTPIGQAIGASRRGPGPGPK